MCLLLNKKNFSIEKVVGFFPIVGFPRVNLVFLLCIMISIVLLFLTVEFLYYNC